MSIFTINIYGQSDDNCWPIYAEYQNQNAIRTIGARDELILSNSDLLHLSEQVKNPRAYGTFLGKRVFTTNIISLLQAALRDSRDMRTSRGIANQHSEPDIVHVVLYLDPRDQKLNSLHWEWLSALDGGSWRFIGLRHDSPLSQYVQTNVQDALEPLGRHELRALVLVARPLERELPYFSVRDTVEYIRETFKELRCTCTVLASQDDIPDADGPPSKKSLLEHLRDAKSPYTVLHVVCHGKRTDADSLLYFSDRYGASEVVSSDSLIDGLAGLRTATRLPRFGFLAACETAKKANGAGEAMWGLAHRLVRELGMHSVLGMSDYVSIATARQLTKTFYTRLWDHGFLDLALAEATSSISDSPDVLVPALYTSVKGQPLFTDIPDRELNSFEIHAGLQLLDQTLAVRAPAFQGDIASQRLILRAIETDGQHGADSNATALSCVSRISMATTGLTFKELAFRALSGKPLSPYTVICPSPGFAPFSSSADEGRFFFGRDALIRELCERSRRPGLVGVTGPSGCGKSSLLRAGLMANLPGPPVLLILTDDNPVVQLDRALAGNSRTAPLLVDQVEVILEDRIEQAFRTNFIERLVSEASERCIILAIDEIALTTRDEATNLLSILEKQLTVMQALTPTEQLRAINRQAREANIILEDGLDCLLIEDAGTRQGSMALTQMALHGLYSLRYGQWIRIQKYVEAGRIRGFLINHAEAFYANLFNRDERAYCEYLLLRLAFAVDENVFSEGTQMTMEQILPAGSDGQARQMLIQLARARLVVLRCNKSTTSGNTSVEIELIHPELLKWPNLMEWYKQEAASLKLRQRLLVSAIEWSREEESDKFLTWRDQQLDGATELLDSGRTNRRHLLNSLETRFLFKCRDHQHKEISDLAEERRQAAEKQQLLREHAEVQSRIALSRQLAAQADQAFGQQPNYLHRSLLLASEAMLRAPIPLRECDRAMRQCLSLHGRPISRMIHWAAVSIARFSPDGSLLATIAADLTVRLWESDTGRQIIRMFVQAVPTSLDFSANGKLLAAGCIDGTVRVWEVPSLRETFRLRHQGPVTVVRFAPDERCLATASLDASVRFWATTQGEELQRFDHTSGVVALAFSRSGRSLATIAQDHVARVFNSLTGEVRAELPHDRAVRTFALSPDGKYLATATSEPIAPAEKWDALPEFLETARRLADKRNRYQHSIPDWLGRGITAHSNPVRYYQAAVIWEVSTRRRISRLVHFQEVLSMEFSPTGKYLATGCEDGFARTWAVEEQGLEVSRLRHVGPVCGVAYSPCGRYLATACGMGELGLNRDNTARIWDARPGKDIELLRLAHDYPVTQVSFSTDGRKLATIAQDGVVRIWQGQIFGAAHTENITEIILSPDGKFVATNDKAAVYIWSVDDLRPVRKYMTTSNIVQFSADSQWLVLHSTSECSIISTESEDRVEITAVAAQLAVCDASANLLAVQFGSTLQVSTRDRQVILNEKLNGRATNLLFSTDGHYLLVRLIGASAPKEDVIVFSVNNDHGTSHGLRVGIDISNLGFTSKDNVIVLSTPTSVSFWDPSTGYCRVAHDCIVCSAVDDVNYIAIIRSARQLMILDDSGNTVSVSSIDCDHVDKIYVSNNGQFVAWSGIQGGSCIQSIDGYFKYEVDPDFEVESMAFSDNNHFCVLSGKHTGLVVYDLKNRRVAFRSLTDEKLLDIHITPDSQYIVGVCEARRISESFLTVWSLTTYREIAREKSNGRASQGRWSPDYSFRIEADETQLKILRWRPSDLLAVAKSVACSNLTQREWQQYLPDYPYEETFQNLPIHMEEFDSAISLAQQGDIAGAVTGFSDLKRRDASIYFDPNVEARWIAAWALIGSADKDAGFEAQPSGKIAAALLGMLGPTKKEPEIRIDSTISKLRAAQVLVPELELNPDATQSVLAVAQCTQLLNKAIDSGDLAAASMLISEMRKLVGSLPLDGNVRRIIATNEFDADATARILYAKKIRQDAIVQASDVQDYRRRLLTAAEIDPRSTENVEESVNDWYAYVLAAEADRFAKNGNIDEAERKFSEAARLSPDSKIDPRSLTLRIAIKSVYESLQQNIRSGDLDNARRNLNFLLENNSAVQQDAYFWNGVCWFGALAGDSDRVLFAADNALRDEPENIGFLDTRGIARSLSKDIAVRKLAVEDLRQVVRWSEDPQLRQSRQEILSALECGQNPFTEDFIRELARQG